jgi:hypothetical protein
VYQNESDPIAGSGSVELFHRTLKKDDTGDSIAVVRLGF